MKYRSHRGGLAESMETLFECKTWEEMSEHIRKAEPMMSGCIVVTPYGRWAWPDERIGWKEVYLVTMEHAGARIPVGFMDSNGAEEDENGE